MSFLQRRRVCTSRFGGFSGNDLSGVFLLLQGLDLALKDRLGFVEFVHLLFRLFQFTAQTSIDRTDRFVPHHRKRFGNVCFIGFEFHLAARLLQYLQPGFEAKRIVKDGPERGLSGLRPCSHGRQMADET